MTKRALLTAILFLLALGACAPTPGYLERWANRDGSEEMFAGFLHNPDVTQEVRDKALQLLIDQWQYSSSLFLNGRVLREVPDPAHRDAAIAANIGRLSERYENAETRSAARDATYQIRYGTDSAELHAQLDEILLRYVNRDWSPCVESGGAVANSQVFLTLGAGRAAPRILTVINEGSVDDVMCVMRTIGNVPWITESAEIGAALTARWDAGRISDVPQFNFEILEFLMRFRTVPAVRDWFFARLADPAFDPTFKNAVLDHLGRTPAEGDVDRYVPLLANTTYTRWSAAQAILDAGGSDGLRAVLQRLPADSEYAYYDGQVRPDGFRSVADRVFCPIGKLRELGDNARRVFEESLALESMPARALSLSCLKVFGDAQTVGVVTTWAEGLGRVGIPVPGFGEGTTLQSLVGETVAAIQERLAAPR